MVRRVRGWRLARCPPGVLLMRKQYHVHLTPEQRAEAQAIRSRGTHAALTVRHARILLEADESPRRRVRQWLRYSASRALVTAT